MRQATAFSALVVLLSQPGLATFPAQNPAALAPVPKPNSRHLALDDLPEDIYPVTLTLEGHETLPDTFPFLEKFTLPSSSYPVELQELGPYLSAYWLSDRKVEWKGGTYLLAYRSNLAMQSINTADVLRGRSPINDLTFHEEWINERSIETITPRSELSKAKFGALLEKLKKLGTVGNRQSALYNLKVLDTSLLIYLNDTDDVFPSAHSTGQAETMLQPYFKDRTLYRSLNPNGGQLLYNTHLAGVAARDIPSPSTLPSFYDSLSWPDGGRPVAFADGHVQYVGASDWPSVAVELRKRFKRAPKPKPIEKRSAEQKDNIP